MKRVLAGCVAALWASAALLPQPLAGAAAVATLGGCFDHSCDFSYAWVESVQGHFLDADTWESAPYDGEWAHFPGGRMISFRPDFGGRVPAEWQTHVSVSARPRADGNASTLGSGNMTLYGAGPNELTLHNGTCAEYYVRVVVRAAPWPPAPPPEPAPSGSDGTAPAPAPSGSSAP